MKKLAVALLIFVASASFAEKSKSKSKEKRFEPVARAAAEYAGSYRGPSEAYGIVLEVNRNGALHGTYVESGRMAVLTPIIIDGANFTATASFGDGSWRMVHGTFANRIRNGKSAFGMRVLRVPVEGMGAVDTFFERMTP